MQAAARNATKLQASSLLYNDREEWRHQAPLGMHDPIDVAIGVADDNTYA
jgi:hypothetical protein